MLGEKRRLRPTVQVPPWPVADDPTAEIRHYSPVSGVELAASPRFFLAALQRFVLFAESTKPAAAAEEADEWAAPADSAAGAEFACSDEFRMYGFKVWRCPRGRGAHDWTACPFAHPGEKARRRDPRRVAYDSAPCPDFRREGRCPRGDACGLAHGVFESWLHPDRYRTQRCRDGAACRRRVCFFAHSPEELRCSAAAPPPAPFEDVEYFDYGGCSSPYAAKKPAASSFVATPSPTSTLAASPFGSPPSLTVEDEVVEAMRGLELGRGRERPSSWVVEADGAGAEFGLARRVGGFLASPATSEAAAGTSSGCRRKQEPMPEPDLDWVSELVN